MSKSLRRAVPLLLALTACGSENDGADSLAGVVATVDAEAAP